jgi:hypothetical protein
MIGIILFKYLTSSWSLRRIDKNVAEFFFIFVVLTNYKK